MMSDGMILYQDILITMALILFIANQVWVLYTGVRSSMAVHRVRKALIKRGNPVKNEEEGYDTVVVEGRIKRFIRDEKDTIWFIVVIIVIGLGSLLLRDGGSGYG